jgi:hypothetical protein
MKNIIIKNSLLILLFIGIDILLISVEKYFIESTNELLFMGWGMALLIVTFILNYRNFRGKKGLFTRVLLAMAICFGVLAVSWFLTYIINWYIVYPLIS